jgi:hypothetical protein
MANANAPDHWMLAEHCLQVTDLARGPPDLDPILTHHRHTR